MYNSYSKFAKLTSAESVMIGTLVKIDGSLWTLETPEGRQYIVPQFDTSSIVGDVFLFTQSRGISAKSESAAIGDVVIF